SELDDRREGRPAEVVGADGLARERVVELVEAAAPRELTASLGECVGRLVKAVPPQAAAEEPVRVQRAGPAPDAAAPAERRHRDEARLVERDRRDRESRPELSGIGETLDQSAGHVERERLHDERDQRDDRPDRKPLLPTAGEGEEEAGVLVVAALEH